MLATFWYVYLYQPVFNALVWIYINVADRNLGWAVIWLTVFLRIILLPLTIKSEHDAVKQEKAHKEAEEAAKIFKNDHIAQKEEIRKIMRKHSISPWAKAISLGVQLLVLVLLYQVFVSGITGVKVLKTLYSWVDYPGKMDTNFYGFEIGKTHDAIWAGLTAVYLFISILISNRKHEKWESSMFAFLILFPLFTYLALWILPMVKSLFILTSMVFTDIIALLAMPFKPVKKQEKKA